MDAEQTECEHELDHFIGLGIGHFEKCSKCRAEFLRVKDSAEVGDWHYEQVEKEAE